MKQKGQIFINKSKDIKYRNNTLLIFIPISVAFILHLFNTYPKAMIVILVAIIFAIYIKFKILEVNQQNLLDDKKYLIELKTMLTNTII